MRQKIRKTVAIIILMLVLFITSIYANTRENKVVTRVNSIDGFFSVQLDLDVEKAFITGSFTNWKKVSLKKINNKGIVLFLGSFPVKTPGIYQYKFIVEKNGGEQVTMNAPGNTTADAPNSMFIMPGIKVYSSRNTVSPGGTVYIAAERYTTGGKRELLDPHWTMEKVLPGITIDSAGKLIVSHKVKVRNKETLNITGTVDGTKLNKEIKLVPEDSLKGKYRVHYFRFDKRTFPGWNVWNWNGEKDAKSIMFSEDTDFGKLAGLDQKNAIVRHSVKGNDWGAKETDDINLSDKPEVFVVEGDREIYTDFRDAVMAAGPRVFGALMDDTHKVTAYLSVPPLKNTYFDLWCDDEKISTSVTHNRVLEFDIPDKYKFTPWALYEIKASKLFAPSRVRMRNALNTLYYPGEDMGATYTEDKIKTRLWAPTAAKVDLVIYDYESFDNKNGKEIPMKRNSGGTWLAEIDRKEFYGKYYKYKLTFYPKTRYEKVTYAVDPYAKAVGINGQKGVLIDTINDEKTIPKDWKPGKKPPLKALVDSIIYELHVRDFSVDENSGIRQDHKGKFMAFTHDTTHHSKDPKVKTCLAHLKELGVTHVHLLPVYDFATVDETKLDDPGYNKFNWGYDPRNYNVPEGSYSTNPGEPTPRILEFRKMVQSMHDNDLRVIMDVVYNHTWNNSVFEPIVPGYYYRTDRFGIITNGSGCGNEVASERPMVRKFIVDSVKYWAKAYNIDGFRFDLMGLIDIGTMLEIVESLHKIDPTIIVYGEPWTAGGSSLPGNKQTAKGNLPYIFKNGTKLAAFNDDLRDNIRGGNWDPRMERGYVTGNTSVKSQVYKGVIGSIERLHDDKPDAMLTLNPDNTINYVAAHDNFCLMDQILIAMGHHFPKPRVKQRNDNIDKKNVLKDHRVKRQILANGIILTSQGIPFIHAGDEILRTKFGDDNSYKSSDEINRIRWNWKKDYKEVFDYYRGLIELRKAHPAFRMRTAEQVQKHFKIIPSPDDTVAYILINHANDDKWKDIIVIYNPHEESKTIHLPPGKWHIAVNDKQAGTETIKGTEEITGKVEVPGISMMVLFVEK